MLAQDGVDKMEEKTWVISKKGEKILGIGTIIVGPVLTVFLYFYFTNLNFFDIEDLFFYISIALIDLTAFLIFKAAGNWKNPKIIKMLGDEVITEEKFNNGRVEKNEVPIKGIYKITIKRWKSIIEYRLPDGREFIWRLIRPRYTKEDREKLQEVLNEILKRVDKNKVEIVDRR